MTSVKLPSPQRSLLLASVILFAMFGRVDCTHAGNIHYRFSLAGLQLALAGQIVPGDASKIKNAIDDARKRGSEITSIRLNSVGGNLYESVSILRMVRSVGLTTVVGESDTCASSCFLILAAGRQKVVSPRARVGVHAASDNIYWKSKKSLNGAQAAVRIAKLLRVPYGIRNKMLKTPPTRMAWLGRSDLQTMQVTFQ